MKGPSATMQVALNCSQQPHSRPFWLQCEKALGTRLEEPLINLRKMAHCAIDSRARWTGS